MVKRIIKNHYKKFIYIMTIILILFVVVQCNTYIQPYIQPYFFKTKNIEKLSGLKIPNDYIIYEYEVDAEPTYTLGGIKGIKGIYSKIWISKDSYESLKEKLDYEEDEFYIIKNMKYLKNYESLNIENVEEIRFRRKSPIGISNIEKYGIWTKWHYTSTSIAVVLTKEKHEINNEFVYVHYLYVFS